EKPGPFAGPRIRREARVYAAELLRCSADCAWSPVRVISVFLARRGFAITVIALSLSQAAGLGYSPLQTLPVPSRCAKKHLPCSAMGFCAPSPVHVAAQRAEKKW